MAFNFIKKLFSYKRKNDFIDTIEQYKLHQSLAGEATYRSQRIKLPRFNNDNKPILGSILQQIIGDEAQHISSGQVIFSNVSFKTETLSLVNKNDVQNFNICDTLHYCDDDGEVYPIPGRNVIVSLHLNNNKSLVLHARTTYISYNRSYYIRLSWSFQDCSKEDDLHTSKTESGPIVRSTMIVYDFSDPIELFKKYEPIEQRVVKRIKSSKRITDEQDEVVFEHLVGKRPVANVYVYANRLYSNDRYVDALVNYLETYNSLKLNLTDASSQEREVLFDCVSKIAHCYSIIGNSELSDFYQSFLNDYKDVYQEASKLSATRISKGNTALYKTFNLGFVLHYLFSINSKMVHGLTAINDDGTITSYDKTEDILEIDANKLFLPGATITIPYSLAHYNTNFSGDKSISYYDNSIIIRCDRVRNNLSPSLQRITILVPTFIHNDSKRNLKDQMIAPQCVSFIFDGEATMAKDGDNPKEIIKNAQKLESKQCVFQSLFEWKRVLLDFDKAKDEQILEAFSTYYKIGFCLVELNQYEYAIPSLFASILPLKISHITEYINALCNSNDARALKVIKTFENIDCYLEEAGEVKQFKNFLKRRKAYVLIEKHKFDDAKQLLLEIREDPDQAEFANGELEYIEQQSK